MVNNIFVQQYVFFMKLDMASVPQWGHQRHIVFKTINQNVAKCHLFHDQRPWQGFSVDFVPFRIMASTAGHILINYYIHVMKGPSKNGNCTNGNGKYDGSRPKQVQNTCLNGSEHFHLLECTAEPSCPKWHEGSRVRTLIKI